MTLVTIAIRPEDVGPTPGYGRHDAYRIAHQRNCGLIQEEHIIWGIDLVPYWRAARNDFKGRHRNDS